MPRKEDSFVHAVSESVREDLAGAAWPVYEHFEIVHEEIRDESEKVYEDTFIYAPLRLPPSKSRVEIFNSLEYERDKNLKWLYAPVRDTPDLFLRFANLSHRKSRLHDKALEVMLEWVTNYGVLGLEDLGCSKVPEREAKDRERRESLRGFRYAAWEAARCLELYEASNAPDGKAEAILEKYGADGSTPRIKKEWARIVAADTVGEYVSRDCYPVFYRVRKRISRGLTGYPAYETVDFKQGWAFRSLLGAMYLQMMAYMQKGGGGCTCKRPGCYRIVTFQSAGDPSLQTSSSRKHRTHSNKEYCSKACKQWWSDNYGNSEKAKQKRRREEEKRKKELS